MKLKKLKLIAAAALAFTLPGAALAGALIDFHDGNGFIEVGGADWGPTSIFGQNSTGAIQAWALSGGACPASTCNFYVNTMARLVGTIDNAGNDNTPAINGSTKKFEVTLVARFLETVTKVTATGAEFATVAGAQPGSFFEIFYDTTTNSNQLTGGGFNDGVLIAKADTINFTTAKFDVTNTSAVPLDNFGPNNYTGQNTVTGSGSSGDIIVSNFTLDSSYITPDPATGGFQLLIDFNNVSEAIPFTSVNPAACFQTAATGTAVGGTQASGTAPCSSPGFTQVNGLLDPSIQNGGVADPNGGVVPTIGNPNGGASAGPDFVSQTDFNSAPQSVLPEPGVVSLLGAILAAAGFVTSRRRKDVEEGA